MGEQAAARTCGVDCLVVGWYEFLLLFNCFCLSVLSLALWVGWAAFFCLFRFRIAFNGVVDGWDGMV